MAEFGTNISDLGTSNDTFEQVFLKTKKDCYVPQLNVTSTEQIEQTEQKRRGLRRPVFEDGHVSVINNKTAADDFIKYGQGGKESFDRINKYIDALHEAQNAAEGTGTITGIGQFPAQGQMPVYKPLQMPVANVTVGTKRSLLLEEFDSVINKFKDMWHRTPITTVNDEQTVQDYSIIYNGPPVPKSSSYEAQKESVFEELENTIQFFRGMLENFSKEVTQYTGTYIPTDPDSKTEIEMSSDLSQFIDADPDEMSSEIVQEFDFNSDAVGVTNETPVEISDEITKEVSDEVYDKTSEVPDEIPKETSDEAPNKVSDEGKYPDGSYDETWYLRD